MHQPSVVLAALAVSGALSLSELLGQMAGGDYTGLTLK